MNSSLFVIAVFCLGFALGALAVALWRRQRMHLIQDKFRAELERITQERLLETKAVLDRSSRRQ